MELNKIKLIVVLVLYFSLLQSCKRGALKINHKVDIDGKVVDFFTGQGYSNVTVEVHQITCQDQTRNVLQASTTTDASGSFSFKKHRYKECGATGVLTAKGSNVSMIALLQNDFNLNGKKKLNQDIKVVCAVSQQFNITTGPNCSGIYYTNNFYDQNGTVLHTIAGKINSTGTYISFKTASFTGEKSVNKFSFSAVQTINSFLGPYESPYGAATFTLNSICGNTGAPISLTLTP